MVGDKVMSKGDEESITIEGISSDARLALSQAVHEAGHDISLKVDVTVGRLSEERVGDLLDALEDYQRESSSSGAHDQAQAADRLYEQIARQYRYD